MTGKYYSVNVPIVEKGNGEAAYADADLLFDWVSFQIPRGAAKLTTISLVMLGTNGADGNNHDIELFFAKSINGEAPPSLGTVNGATTQARATKARRHMIGFKLIDTSSMKDDEDLLAYNVLSTSKDASEMNGIILQGDSVPYRNTTDNNSTVFEAGTQTIFLAGIAKGALDFGTAVALNQGGGQAATTAQTQLTTSGTDPRNVFMKGDVVQAQDGAQIGTVVSADSATTLTVDGVAAALANSDTINFKNPIEFIFGFEY
jgi:hypothetical protein|tara:strand:- start:315 stop:1094 length:780 start_codon:yes stop_codon:yes gene_type:complete